jgi:hypothetical protein
MAHSPNPCFVPRPPRVKLAGSVLAVIQFGDQQQIRAKLHQLNINGGLLHVPEPLEEQAPVRVIFHVGSTTVRAGAETITPMWATKGWLQPFRFTDFNEDDRRRLDADLLMMLGGGTRVREDLSPMADVPAETSAEPPVAYGEQQLIPQQENEQAECVPAVPGETCERVATPIAAIIPAAEVPEEASELAMTPDDRKEVILYFDRREDAIRFTVALSSVIFCDQGARSRNDIAKLAREFTKISRVTT